MRDLVGADGRAAMACWSLTMFEKRSVVTLAFLLGLSVACGEGAAPVEGAATQSTQAAVLSEWPGPTNTGVPVGNPLQSVPAMTIRVPGTIIEDVEVTGCIQVQANDVIIRRTRIIANERCGIYTGFGEYTGLLIEDVEVDGSQAPSDGQVLVGSSGYTCRRCNLHHGRTGFGLSSNVVVEDSYVHDAQSLSPETHKSAASGHGGGNVVLRHNRMECVANACSSAVSLYGNFAPIDNVLIEGNQLATTGSYCTYGGSLSNKPFPQGSNVRYLDNHFMTTYHPDCGIYGTVAGFEEDVRGNLWQGNVWDDSAEPVCLHNAECGTGRKCGRRGHCVPIP
ncbi:hypothetical protein JGU66_23645 [Myxococcaceae bacterium JPH2]|nr:hypothetical protein [Myxococcaceae bacterium JPH2]